MKFLDTRPYIIRVCPPPVPFVRLLLATRTRVRVLCALVVVDNACLLCVCCILCACVCCGRARAYCIIVGGMAHVDGDAVHTSNACQSTLLDELASAYFGL